VLDDEIGFEEDGCSEELYKKSSTGPRSRLQRILDSEAEDDDMAENTDLQLAKHCSTIKRKRTVSFNLGPKIVNERPLVMTIEEKHELKSELQRARSDFIYVYGEMQLIKGKLGIA